MGVWDTNYVTDKNFAIIEALSSESTIYGQLDENVSNEILTHLTLPTKYNEHALFSRFLIYEGVTAGVVLTSLSKAASASGKATGGSRKAAPGGVISIDYIACLKSVEDKDVAVRALETVLSLAAAVNEARSSKIAEAESLLDATVTQIRSILTPKKLLPILEVRLASIPASAKGVTGCNVGAGSATCNEHWDPVTDEGGNVVSWKYKKESK